MPVAIVRYHHKLETSEGFFEELEVLAKALPAIVAGALNTSHPDGHLMAADINVRVEKSGRFDQNVIDCSILIFANDYPERRDSLEERKARIVDRVSELSLANCADFSVWILLAEGTYSANFFAATS